eukprot:NODE_5410_length_680_cov_17.706815_g5036_i0.p1 GENE.NODE_5410_length_680_cov_17.706815_g5036_i0~~NODE_5410_length_680_cov_17.706815_g5036_i0.p1  ORF type:complete len:184 (+),score=30.75 NODE_5410_length_680_cov_17.706815_g5036_i0:60-611(+)
MLFTGILLLTTVALGGAYSSWTAHAMHALDPEGRTEEDAANIGACSARCFASRLCTAYMYAEGGGCYTTRVKPPVLVPVKDEGIITFQRVEVNYKPEEEVDWSSWKSHTRVALAPESREEVRTADTVLECRRVCESKASCNAFTFIDVYGGRCFITETTPLKLIKLSDRSIITWEKVTVNDEL